MSHHATRRPAHTARSRAACAVGLLAFALTLTACGESGGDGRPSVSPSTATPATSTSASSIQQPAADDTTPLSAPVSTTEEPRVPQGGRLRGLMAADIDTWDGTDYFAQSWMVNFITCNTLVGYPTTTDPVENLELRPEIAVEMPEVSDDGRTYRFTIRRGVQFSDGRTLTPADVKGTFLRMLDPDAAFQVAGTTYYDGIVGAGDYKAGTADDIRGIEVGGETVTFRLRERNGAFLHALALQFACIVPSDAPRQKANLPPPMTGPYMVTEHTHDRSLRIDRNPVWEENVAAGLPVDPFTFNVDGFDVTIGVPADAQVLRIRNGEADFSFDASCCVGAVAKDLATDPNTRDRFSSEPSLRVTYATFNVNLPPFDDPKVRQAVNYAVDREALAKIAGGELLASPTSGILADTLVPEGAENNPYPASPDLEKAQALLREAAVATPIDAGTIYYPDLAPLPDLAEQLVSDLKKIGVRMRSRGLGPSTYFQFIQDPRNRDPIALAGWEADYPDAGTYFEPLLTSDAARGGSNYGDFEDPALDREIARVHAMPPGPERRAAYAELSYRTSAEQAPWINFHTARVTNLTSERYGRYHFGAVKVISLGLAYVKDE